MCGHESKPRGNHVASRRLVRTCRESLSLGLMVSRQGSHELQSVGLAPVVPQLVVDKHVEVTSQHQPLPVPGGHVEALVVAAGLTANHGCPSSLPHHSSATSEGETHSVLVSSVPVLNIAGQLVLPPLFLSEKQGEEHQKGDDRKNKTFSICSKVIVINNITSPIL